jgi:hypothetical protein
MENLRGDFLYLCSSAQHEDDLLARCPPVQGSVPADQPLLRTIRCVHLPSPEFRLLLAILARRKETPAYIVYSFHESGMPGIFIHPGEFTFTGIKGNQQHLLS